MTSKMLTISWGVLTLSSCQILLDKYTPCCCSKLTWRSPVLIHWSTLSSITDRYIAVHLGRSKRSPALLNIAGFTPSSIHPSPSGNRRASRTSHDVRRRNYSSRGTSTSLLRMWENNPSERKTSRCWKSPGNDFKSDGLSCRDIYDGGGYTYSLLPRM